MDSSSDSMSMTMKPYLHFTPGDTLLFETWVPTSSGAIAGACIGLAVLAIIERWLNGVRGVLEMKWKKRALVMMSSASREASSPSDHNADSAKAPLSLGEATRASVTLSSPTRAARSYPPFISSHDVPRGALFAIQALIYYVLMLVVMTFQVAYLISIVVGLMVGEVLFGRFNSFRAAT